MAIELVEAIDKYGIHFSIQRIIFPTGCMEKFAWFLSNNFVTCEANHVKCEKKTMQDSRVYKSS